MLIYATDNCKQKVAFLWEKSKFFFFRYDKEFADYQNTDAYKKYIGKLLNDFPYF